MKLPFGGAQGAVFDILCPLWVRQAHQPSAMQWSRSEREKMKLPFGGAQGADFIVVAFRLSDRKLIVQILDI